jgi:hypothetical protein
MDIKGIEIYNRRTYVKFLKLGELKTRMCLKISINLGLAIDIPNLRIGPLIQLGVDSY